MSLEKEFPPPQVTAAPTQVPIQEQIAKAFTDDAKTITPAGTRHEETATAAGPDQIPTKSLQVSNNQEEGTKEPSWAEVAVSEVKSVKEHLGSDHKPSKAAAPEAELEAVTKKMGEMTIDRAKELASSAAETAKGAAVEARDKTEGLAAAIADATSHGIQTAKSTITEAGQTLVRAGEGGAERVTEVAQSATAKAGEAGHAPAETLQGAAHTVVETAEHAIAAVEDKIEEVAERAHDIAEAGESVPPQIRSRKGSDRPGPIDSHLSFFASLQNGMKNHLILRWPFSPTSKPSSKASERASPKLLVFRVPRKPNLIKVSSRAE